MKRLILFLSFVFVFAMAYAASDYGTKVQGSRASGSHFLTINDEGAIPVISYEHYTLEDGRFFILADYTATINIAAPKYYSLTIPQGVTLHVSVGFSCINGAARLLGSTTETMGNKGTTLNARNPNLKFSAPTNFYFYKDTNTTNASATYYDIDLIGTATSSNPSGTRAGSSSDSKFERCLIPGNYIYKILPLIDGISGTFFFYGYSE